MPKKNDKRIRLVEAADKLFHEKGYNLTTLANIAELADVPLGNVYYYFKSKESIAQAVIERRMKFFQSMTSEWEQFQAVDRLKAFIEHSISSADDRARFGDATGSLCQELGKQGGILGQYAASLMKTIVEWVENQFKQLNSEPQRAEQLAASLVSTLQGMNLLTVTFKDPEYLQRQTGYLNNWLEQV